MSEYNVDYGVVKKPHNDRPLTNNEVNEWMKCRESFWYFAENYAQVLGPKGMTYFEAREYQVEMLDVIDKNRFIVINAPRQCGKRLSLDTIVPTPMGYTTIGDICIGDKIIGADGKPASVSYLSPIEENPDAYKVTFSTGEEILADAEHLWTVNEAYRGSHTVNTQYMVDTGVTVGAAKKSGSIAKRFSIDTIQSLDLPDADLPIDPYVLGYWLGDGESNGSYIYIGENQNGDFENFTSYCEKNNIPFSIKPPSHERTVWKIRVHGLYSKLEKLGCRNNKHIPILYLRASKRQRELLIQGIMDSDGNISKTKRGFVEITQKSKTLIYDIHELLSSMGTRFPLPKEKVVKQFNSDGEIYYRISGSLYLDDYQPFRLERKLNLVPQSPHPSRKRSTKKRQIVSIEKTDPVPMRCIQVDNESHLFCVSRSFIPTHNTQSMAVYMMWVTIFFEDSTSGFTSFKGSNIKDFIRRCQAVYEFLPDWLKPPVTRFNTTEIAFTNNSMLYGEVSGETALRGKTITGAGIAVLDELAYVSDADEMLTSLLPSLEAAGSDASTKVIVISTPNTSIGTYAELVNGAIDGSNGWTYYKVDPSLIPNRGKEWREGMIKKMGRNRYLQEFEGHFLSDNSGLINSSVIEAIEHKDPVEEIGDLKIYVQSLQGRKVCVSVDVSEGVGRDNHCFQIIDIDSLEQIGEFANNTMNQTQYFRKIVRTIHLLHDRGVDIDMSYLGIESNGMGNGILRLYESSNDEFIHRLQMINDVNQQGVPTGKIGLTTTNPKKIEACGTLKDLVEEGKITLYSQSLLNELRRFTKQGATFKAEKGAKDDRVMALVICMTMLKQIANGEEGVFDVLNEVTMDADEEVYDIYW